MQVKSCQTSCTQKQAFEVDPHSQMQNTSKPEGLTSIVSAVWACATVEAKAQFQCPSGTAPPNISQNTGLVHSVSKHRCYVLEQNHETERRIVNVNNLPKRSTERERSLIKHFLRSLSMLHELLMT